MNKKETNISIFVLLCVLCSYSAHDVLFHALRSQLLINYSRNHFILQMSKLFRIESANLNDKFIIPCRLDFFFMQIQFKKEWDEKNGNLVSNCLKLISFLRKKGKIQFAETGGFIIDHISIYNWYTASLCQYPYKYWLNLHFWDYYNLWICKM